ncbi:hypothetical protein Cgig2_024706 [Carnegiea gigantea]|uniref:Uncharacterized protein n=1 Tax=Carnegiea gigantea TaxID=171969 RepID=A0A9Q1GJ99_9CARY|nr:hypothetical protein Cgig2_024706 [Carnegiea gigantea]
MDPFCFYFFFLFLLVARTSFEATFDWYCSRKSYPGVGAAAPVLLGSGSKIGMWVCKFGGSEFVFAPLLHLMRLNFEGYGLRWRFELVKRFRWNWRGRFRGEGKFETVWDEFERLKVQASQVGTEVDDDELFLQAVGGKDKKGTVYGLEMESEAYYPRFGRRSSPSSSYTPSIVSQMETRLKKIRGGTSSYKGRT